MKYSLTIGHLFCDLLNMFGDRGNTAALSERLKWRGHEAQVIRCEQDDEIDFSDFDIIILGGGGEKDELAALSELMKKKDELKAYVEDGGVLLALCGGYQMLGKTYKCSSEETEGLGILDIKQEFGERFIGNVIAETSITGENIKIAGFENHGGRIDIGNHTPFAHVLTGSGNNGEDKTEGVIYKNVIATYLHGPLLPKNPKLTDYILEKAIEKKYGEMPELSQLPDTLENEALSYAVKRFTETEAR